MTVVLIVKCDGTIADRPTISLGICRGGYPTPRALQPEEAVDDALRHGWTTYGGRDLCPSCTRARSHGGDEGP